MKFQKIVEYNMYWLSGDRMMEDVIYLLNIQIDAVGNVFCASAQPSEDAIAYLEQIGGKGAPGHWQQELLAMLQDEDCVAEILGEDMTEEEFAEWEHILVPEKAAPAVAPRAIKASLASDIVDGWMENN